MEMYQMAMTKLKTAKDHVKSLDARIKLLEEENRTLSVRGAVGFENLTPRPDLREVSFYYFVRGVLSFPLSVRELLQRSS